MATKITDMTAGGAVGDTDLFETVQSASTRKVTAAQLKTYMTVPRRMDALIGDGAAATFDVAHNFNTRKVHVTVYRTAAPYDTVIPDVARFSVNAVRISGFGAAPAVGEYTVLVSE